MDNYPFARYMLVQFYLENKWESCELPKQKMIHHPANAVSMIIMMTKPTIKPMVAILLCGSDCDSGISSSTTTYTIAPAEKANRYGNIGDIHVIKAMVNNPAIGSTIPLNAPNPNALFLDNPSLCNGIDMIAPSGRF